MNEMEQGYEYDTIAYYDWNKYDMKVVWIPAHNIEINYSEKHGSNFRFTKEPIASKEMYEAEDQVFKNLRMANKSDVNETKEILKKLYEEAKQKSYKPILIPVELVGRLIEIKKQEDEIKKQGDENKIKMNSTISELLKLKNLI